LDVHSGENVRHTFSPESEIFHFWLKDTRLANDFRTFMKMNGFDGRGLFTGWDIPGREAAGF